MSNIINSENYLMSVIMHQSCRSAFFQDWCYRFALSIFVHFCHHKLRSSFNVPSTHMSHFVHRPQIEWYWLANSHNILKCLQQGIIVEWKFGRTEHRMRVPNEITGSDTFTITNTLNQIENLNNNNKSFSKDKFWVSFDLNCTHFESIGMLHYGIWHMVYGEWWMAKREELYTMCCV